jgi:hypothetical protein
LIGIIAAGSHRFDYAGEQSDFYAIEIAASESKNAPSVAKLDLRAQSGSKPGI